MKSCLTAAILFLAILPLSLCHFIVSDDSQKQWVTHTHALMCTHTRTHICTHTYTHTHSNSSSTTINATLFSNWKQVPLFQSEKYYCFSSLVFFPSTLLGVLIKVGRRMFEDSSVSCQRLLHKANTEALSHARNTHILCTLTYYLRYFLLQCDCSG